MADISSGMETLSLLKLLSFALMLLPLYFLLLSPVQLIQRYCKVW